MYIFTEGDSYWSERWAFKPRFTHGNHPAPTLTIVLAVCQRVIKKIDGCSWQRS